MPIPAKYLGNALPYYIDVIVENDGSNNYTYTCLNAAESIKSAFDGGRTLMIRARETFETGYWIDAFYALTRNVIFPPNANVSFVYEFFRPNGNASNTDLYVFATTDGTIGISETFGI